MGLINFSGIASGIDTEGLINATTAATRASRVKPLEDKVADLTGTNDALTELKTRLNAIKDAARGFNSLAGGALTKAATSSDESILSATASNAATNGTYNITVQQKARNGMLTFADAFTDSTAVIDADLTSTTYPSDNERTITIEVGTGGDKKTFSYVIDETKTWADVVNAFNSDATMSAVGVMSAVNVSTDINSPSYRLMVSSLNEGTQKGTIAVSLGSGIMTEAKFNTGSSQPALDSIIDIAGVATGITRPGNSITGIIPGVTLNLQKDSATEVTISVQNDLAASRAKIEDMVTAWNDVVTYLKEQNLIERQEDGANVTNNFGPLSKARVDEGALSSIRSALAAARVSLGVNEDGLPEGLVLASIGLKTKSDGTLQFVPDTVQNVPAFNQLVGEKAEAVNSLLRSFADKLTETGQAIDSYTGFNRLIDQTINSNKRQITDYNKRILEAEANIERTAQGMRQRFARLESQIGRLNSQQQQLLSALG